MKRELAEQIKQSKSTVEYIANIRSERTLIKLLIKYT